MNGESLADVLAALERIAKLAHAEPWDNVGLLVEPPVDGAGPSRRLHRALLTIDLTEAVLEAAIAGGADLIVAYHPPIFTPLVALRLDRPGERILLRAIRHGVAIYSPHTALDAAPGGVCDWLAEGLGDLASSRAITSDDPEARPPVGAGRVVTLSDPAPLEVVVARIKAHLALDQVRLATAPGHANGRPVREVALCPGAGGSLFAPLDGPDLYLTGEMRHHDVLAKVAAGASVVLTDHTNCERGYLPVLARAMRGALPNLRVDVAADDRDPLRIV